MGLMEKLTNFFHLFGNNFLTSLQRLDIQLLTFRRAHIIYIKNCYCSYMLNTCFFPRNICIFSSFDPNTNVNIKTNNRQNHHLVIYK